jgi:Tol biopolymer transport system component
VRSGRAPTWSPNGGLIAFITFRRHHGVANYSIAVMRPDGHGFTVLVRGDAPLPTQLDFSPDGRRLAFLRFAPGPTASTTIGVIDVATHRVKLIADRVTGVVDDVAWTPDGRRIAYLRDRPQPPGHRWPPTQIYTIRPDGSGRRLLFTLPFDQEGTFANNLAWQPLR